MGNKSFLFNETAISLNKKMVIQCSLNKAHIRKRGEQSHESIYLFV